MPRILNASSVRKRGAKAQHDRRTSGSPAPPATSAAVPSSVAAADPVAAIAGEQIPQATPSTPGPGGVTDVNKIPDGALPFSQGRGGAVRSRRKRRQIRHGAALPVPFSGPRTPAAAAGAAAAAAPLLDFVPPSAADGLRLASKNCDADEGAGAVWTFNSPVEVGGLAGGSEAVPQARDVDRGSPAAAGSIAPPRGEAPEAGGISGTPARHPSTPATGGAPATPATPATPDALAEILHNVGLLQAKVREIERGHAAKIAAIHAKWERRHGRSRERFEAKLSEAAEALHRLSDEWEGRCAALAKAHGEQAGASKRKEELLHGTINELSRKLEAREAKLEQWGGRMKDMEVTLREVEEREKAVEERERAVDNRQAELDRLRRDIEERSALLKEKAFLVMKEYKANEQEVRDRDLTVESDIRRRVEAEMAEQQSLRRLGQSMAQRLIGFGGRADQECNLRNQKRLLDLREGELGEREEAAETVWKERAERLQARERELLVRERELAELCAPRTEKNPGEIFSPVSRKEVALAQTQTNPPARISTPRANGGKRSRTVYSLSRSLPGAKKVCSLQSATPSFSRRKPDKFSPHDGTKKISIKTRVVVPDTFDSDSSEDEICRRDRC